MVHDKHTKQEFGVKLREEKKSLLQQKQKLNHI